MSPSSLIWLIPLIGIMLIAVIAVPWKKLLPATSTNTTNPGNMTSWRMPAVTGICLAVAAVTMWWYWDAIMGLSFFLKLMLCVPLIILGWRLSKGLTFTLGSSLIWAGTIGVMFVILMSNFGHVAAQGVNTAEEEIADIDIGSLFVGCPGSFSKGDTIVVRRGCTTELNSPNGTNFRAKDGAFDGMLTQYVDIEQPFAGYYTLKPNKGFPEGISEVEVTTIPPK